MKINIYTYNIAYYKIKYNNNIRRKIEKKLYEMKGNWLKCIVTASSCVEISNKYLLVRTTINLNKKTNANYDDDGDGDGKCGYVSLVSLSAVSTRIMIS